MRSVRYFLTVLFLLLGTSFACLNAEIIDVNLYVEIYQLPLSLLLILVLGIGIIIGFLGLSKQFIRLRIENTQLRNQLKIVEQEVSHLRMMPVKSND